MNTKSRVVAHTLAYSALMIASSCTKDAGGEANESVDVGESTASTTCAAPVPVFNAVDPLDGHICHPSACTPDFCSRGDISALAKEPATQPLQDRLATLDCSPHSVTPLQIFAEADPATGGMSQLFQYYLLDNTGFQPSVFTTIIPGLNDTAMRTSWGANCDLPPLGAVRLALEPKPGLPTDPDDPRAFIDIFTDLRSLFVINNESGWYEGWMIHDLRVADVAPADANGKALFGKITPEDAAALLQIGPNNVPGNFFTVDGKPPHFPSPDDHFPDKVTNVVSLNLSMGAYNALQQSDAHNYWEFNYTTNWIHPLYELPFTGGFPANSPTEPASAYPNGLISFRQSIVPGNSPGDNNRSKDLAVKFGDNPDNPRDPDRFDAEIDSQREFRERFAPSGIAREAFLNAFQRLASFEPNEHNLTQRLLDGYKAAVATVDTNRDGIVSAAEGDIDTPNPNCPEGDNSCIFLLPRSYNRFAVTREINDGLLAPRFATSTRGFVLSGSIVTGFPQFGASQGEDSDDR